MFEGKHFQPQNNSALLGKGDKEIMSLCSNIKNIVNDSSFFEIESAEEGRKKAYKRFMVNLYYLMFNIIKMDTIIEEMWSRIFVKQFNRYSPLQGYYEALEQMGCNDDTLREIKIIRKFRNLCCHSISLKDALNQKKDAKKYLLTIKPVVRSLYQKTSDKFQKDVLNNMSDKEFDDFLQKIISNKRKKDEEFKKKSFLELYGLKNDRKYNYNQDKEIILNVLKKQISKQRKEEREISMYTLCAHLILDVGYIMQKEKGETTYNQILFTLRNLGEIAKLEERNNFWGGNSNFKRIHEIFDLSNHHDVNSRKQIKWRGVYFDLIIEFYEILSQEWQKERISSNAKNR